MSNIVTGYGICTSELTHEIDGKHLFELIKTAPKLFQRMNQDFGEECFVLLEDSLINDGSYPVLTEWVNNHGNYNYGGLAAILQEVIEETEDIRLCVERDFDGNDYLIFASCYPWTELNEKERVLTEEKVAALIDKYLSIATPESLYAEYQVIESE